MPQFDVTVVQRVERTYVITVLATDEDAASEEALAQYSKVKESGKLLPWEAMDCYENVEIDYVEVLW